MKHKTDVLGQRFTLSKAIDFMRGANARVFLGTYTQEKGIEHSAIKIMRTDSSDPQSRKYIQIFQTELLILTTLKDTPGISSPRDCGLIKFDNIHNMDDDVTVEGQTGEVIHMGPDGLLELHEKLNNDNLDDWLPFLSIELRSQNLEICFDRIIRDRNGSVDSFLMPVPSAIETSYQLVRILASAHSNKIIYADTKPVHFYWHYNNRDPQQIYVIDWNCSQILPKDNLAYYQLDLKELVANIIFPLFTGRILAGSRSNKGSTPSEVEHQLNTEYKIGEWKKEEKKRLDKEIMRLLEDTIVKRTVLSAALFLERLDIIRESWASGEKNKDFLRAINHINLSYYHLEQSRLHLTELAEGFAQNNFREARNEARRLNEFAKDVLSLWGLTREDN